jgi:phenylacetate-CoA ligase
MLNRQLFIFAHWLGEPAFYATYRDLVADQWKPYRELEQEQEKKLQHLIEFAYDQVPYYRTLFKTLGLQPRDIRSIEDLEKLPVLTKEIIKANWEELKPATLSSMDYSLHATGGSTGTPMEFRLSNYDRFLGGALLYRGLGYGGYDIGDRIVFLMGSESLARGQPRIVSKVHELVRNTRKFSAHDMGEADLHRYAGVLASFRPRFMRGYPSSIQFFARWLNENDVAIPSIDAIFTNGETLFPHMRKVIGDTFDCEVFNNYGLNDGGVGAFECQEHSGLHIDTERSIMEVVDQDNRQLMSGEGAVLATSLYNFAMPFIRFSTGDIATLADTECDCGRHSKLLSQVKGRSADILVTPEGKSVHGWFFNSLLYEPSNGIKEYQVIQTAIDTITIKIVPDRHYDETKLSTIREKIAQKSSGWTIQFEVVEAIDRTRLGKFKYIINEMAQNAR